MLQLEGLLSRHMTWLRVPLVCWALRGGSGVTAEVCLNAPADSKEPVALKQGATYSNTKENLSQAKENGSQHAAGHPALATA